MMLFANLKNSLKEGIKHGYELKGSDIFLINKSIELILNAAKINPMSVSHLDETTTTNDINALLRNQSMFGETTAVVLRTPELTRVILAPDVKVFETIDCNPMTADLVVKLIINQFSAAGKKITHDAAVTLASSQGNNYARVNNEIIKLQNYFSNKDTLTVDDIIPIISKTEEFQIYELGNTLLKKNVSQADAIYANLTASGVDDYIIFSSLISQTRRLFFGLLSTATDAELASFLKVHPYAITASRRDGRHLQNKIASIYEEALELEYKIKSGALNSTRAVAILQGLML